MSNTKDFYYKKSRLNQLRGFCAVVQAKCSGVGGAEKLNIAPATISKRILTLEDDLGVKLFERYKHHHLRLTEEGKIFYDLASKQLNGMNNLFDNFNEHLKEYRNKHLKIAGLDAILQRIIPYVNDFKIKYPDVNITLSNIYKEKAWERMKNGEIDLAFYPSDIDEDCPVEIEKNKISDYSSYWVVYEGHPLAKKDEKDITREDLSNYPFGVIKELVYAKSFEALRKEYNLKCSISLENGTIEMLKTMVRLKMCITTLNAFYINEKDKNDFVLKNITSGLSKMFYCSYSLKNTTHKEVSNRFLEIVKNNHINIFH